METRNNDDLTETRYTSRVLLFKRSFVSSLLCNLVVDRVAVSKLRVKLVHILGIVNDSIQIIN